MIRLHRGWKDKALASCTQSNRLHISQHTFDHLELLYLNIIYIYWKLYDGDGNYDDDDDGSHDHNGDNGNVDHSGGDGNDSA
jgi:hypothetical protein